MSQYTLSFRHTKLTTGGVLRRSAHLLIYRNKIYQTHPLTGEGVVECVLRVSNAIQIGQTFSVGKVTSSICLFSLFSLICTLPYFILFHIDASQSTGARRVPLSTEPSKGGFYAKSWSETSEQFMYLSDQSASRTERIVQERRHEDTTLRVYAEHYDKPP
eukprot:GHVQ01003061.1.p1 GENE.GHVQ01003061.1~~GHVQ01003061.1.p1  ORF type:complete len:160 (+),score=11.92 GHVQ01003061.1:289-768(+)